MVIWCGLLLGMANAAYSLSTLIPAANRVDMIYDDARHLIYISQGTQVLRYHVDTETFWSPLEIGGDLSGMDLSPDGQTLAVADRTRSETQVWIHLIDLDTGASTPVGFARAFAEGGTWTVAYGRDHRLLIASRFEGSGWVPLRRYDPATATTETLASIRQDSMLTSSGDAEAVAYAEHNISSGPIGKYDVPSTTLITGPTTGWFGYEIGVNHDGTHVSVPTYGGTFLYDGDWMSLGTIGIYAGPQPIGVVYHPAEDRVFYAWSTTTEVREFETATMTQVAAYDLAYTFTHNGNHAFVHGRLKLAGDGSLLLATVGGGVRMMRFYEPLVADPQALSTDENVAVPVVLSGSVGNGGRVAYTVLEPPVHGTLSGQAPDLVYTPEPNFNGSDQLTFEARYGRARAEAVVAIVVHPGNSLPVARDDVAELERRRLLIPVLANDSDPDGDPLQITGMTQPSAGEVSLSNSGQEILYKAKKGPKTSDSFSYTISDGQGGTATAMVVVNRTP